MTKRLLKTISALLMVASILCLVDGTAFGMQVEGSTVSEVTTAAAEEGNAADADTEENTMTPAETAAAVAYSAIAGKKKGIYLVGICKLAEDTRLLASAEPFKTDEQIDWEARAQALEEYENLGIAVVDNYLNIREGAGTSYDIIGKMLAYNACEVLSTSRSGSWLKIRSGSIEGWVSSEYIMTGEDARELAIQNASLQVEIKASTLNVRMEPSTDSKIWTQANGEEHYDVVRDLGEWIEISLDEYTGYVASKYVDVQYRLNTAVKYYPDEDDPNQPLRSRIVAYAMKWLGGRYVWGGETLGQGVDCSGFTMKVYEYFGIKLTHYSGDQANEGKSISRSQLQKGDLVFYAKDGTINHVAIYIGDGQVIHARSTKRGICITDIDYRTPVKYVTFIE